MIKIGFLGASRGIDIAKRMMKNSPYAEISAICESYEPLCRKAGDFFRENGKKVECFTDYDKFISESGVDAVVIANYANEHAPYAIKALNSGINVLSEVMPVETLAEAVELCEAVEKSGKVYAYSENYCYFDSCFAMRQAYETGDIGEGVLLEGTFINDCSPRWDLLTRGIRNHWRNYVPSTFYCSHSIGPMLYSTGRRAVRVNGFEIPRMNYMAEVGARSGSAAMEVMELDNGGLARSINGNYRSEYEASYRIIGSEGTIECSLGSVSVIRTGKDGSTQRKNIYPTPRAFEYRPEGNEGSIMNGDYAVLGYFIGKILGDDDSAKYSIDVYRALDMALPGLLAFRSILSKGMPIEVPDFRDKEVREKYRYDRYSTRPGTPEEFLLPTSKNGTPTVEDAVYESVQNKFKSRDLKPGAN